jgi:hypothetical protein
MSKNAGMAPVRGSGSLPFVAQQGRDFRIVFRGVAQFFQRTSQSPVH